MADPKQPDTHKITPRDVEPDTNTPAGARRRERSAGDDRGRREDPVVEEADGGDVAGIAGGSVDKKV